jgi:cytochrome c-type biogenesis protein
LFFGGLIPTAIKVKSSIALPMVYGVGTGLPVLIFAVLVSTGVEYLNKVYHTLAKIELYTKKFTGVIFVLVGIYYVLSHIFGIF